jgi:hypothetical protein
MDGNISREKFTYKRLDFGKLGLRNLRAIREGGRLKRGSITRYTIYIFLM